MNSSGEVGGNFQQQADVDSRDTYLQNALAEDNFNANDNLSRNNKVGQASNSVSFLKKS